MSDGAERSASPPFTPSGVEGHLGVADVQSHLESIYDVKLDARAEAFLVGPAAAEALGSTGRAQEELLVSEEDDALSLALYLAPEVLAALRPYSMSTLAPALESALHAYCQMAEGVSHFMYLSRSALEGRQVSLLELEAQAEVDKFASCLLHRWGGAGAGWGPELHTRLFDRVHFLPTLSEPERWRYEEANRLARNYCRKLVPLFAQRRLDRLLSELRYSYRLGAEAKLQYLAAA